MKVKYPKKLLEECPEDVVRRSACANYSSVTGMCKRRWSGRTPPSPCNAWRKRPEHWIKGGDE